MLCSTLKYRMNLTLCPFLEEAREHGAVATEFQYSRPTSSTTQPRRAASLLLVRRFTFVVGMEHGSLQCQMAALRCLRFADL